jgi:hypothetical protein
MDQALRISADAGKAKASRRSVMPDQGLPNRAATLPLRQMEKAKEPPCPIK